MAEKVAEGLQDIVVAESSICYIDGKRGQLVYRGYDIDDLTDNATFVEVAYLLWKGNLPTKDQLTGLRHELNSARELPRDVLAVMLALPRDANPMRMLEACVATLGTTDPQADDLSPEANLAKSIRLTAQMFLITATWSRLRRGRAPIPFDEGRSLAENFLRCLSDSEPDDYAIRTFDTALILHADHELNASTFSARVAAATLSDLHSAVVAAICTLKGPLHGGANEAVMKMLEAIGEPENVEQYMKDLLGAKKKVMGFGHRVYKAKDPRAVILEKMSEELGKRAGQTKWYEMSHRVEEIFQPTVAAKGIFPNVDFYSASAYQVMGIPRDLFTPIFACSRTVGWTAHLMEQYADNRLIRPGSEYIGKMGLKYEPIEARG
jgi:citrate synthase